jgi:Immunoglobulin-like domain of bacterial spore germination
MAVRLLVIVILLAGCAPGGAASTTGLAVATTRSVATTTTAPGPPTTTAIAAPPCLAGDEPFTSRTTGLVGRPEGDAAAIAGLRWDDFEGCQRVVVSLATADQAPATRSGQIEVSVRSDLGVVRIDFGAEIERTAVADAVMDTSLVADAFVVRDSEGELFLDLHVETEVEVRALTPGAPARVVVDLRPASGDDMESAVTGPLAVVMTPNQPEATYPLEVSGYARTPEAAVVIRFSVEGEQVVTLGATAADWLETWGAFSATIQDGPPGNGELLVGDGSDLDTEVVLRIREGPEAER